MSAKQMPSVVIVGRANVGKSTFFNRLSKEGRSLIFDQPGVTRDVISEIITWKKSQPFYLVDTGGVSMRPSLDPMQKEVQRHALAYIDAADIILFMCDGSVGLLPEDRELIALLRKKEKKVFVLINKADMRQTQEFLHEFNALGFPVFPISAAHGTGIDEVMDETVASLPEKSDVEVEKPQMRVVIIGKPNVGKSSLLNTLAKKERVIVSDIPGTTREAVSEPIRFYQEEIQVTDTPGVRRKRGVTEPLEQLMVKSAMRAIDAAHVVVLVVDASEGALSDQELKLAFYAFEEKHKSLIILFNKSDLLTEDIKQDLAREHEEYGYFFDKIAMLSISCKSGKNIGKVLPLIQTVWERSRQQFSDTDLTILFKEQLERRPLYRQGQMLRFYRAKQTRVTPITIQLTVGNVRLWEESHLGFLENQLRRAYTVEGTPIVWHFKKER